jgi:spore germination protein GerM
MAVTACGVSAEHEPVALSSVSGVGPAHGESGHHPQSVRQATTVFLVAGNRLAPVVRQVPIEAGVDGALRALESAPSAAEADRGLRTALPVGGGHLHARIGDGVAVVAVPTAYETLGLVQQVEAVGQIVYTVTAIDGITGVEFTEEGQLIDVPVDRGQLRNGPVTRLDYASIAPLKRG